MIAKRTLSLALLLCVLLAALPLPVSAQTEPTPLAVTEGEILRGFVPAGTVCVSEDPSVAWIDASGDLRALRAGQTTLTADETEYAVTVNAYEDGSQTVGQLKIVARFNDSMQFYDGHVYLIFTAYRDGVTLAVDDLYAGYEIDELYYLDIREDVSAGSNHTGTDAEKYFTLRDGMRSVTLNRGEVVTIGMYRDFDLSVPEAALGSIRNSSLWLELESAVKGAIVEALFRLLDANASESEDAANEYLEALAREVPDYNRLLDGVVDGGVCFNRELYNQKLAWDQFENASYELDITENQLRALTDALQGNLNRFSILKNSCATVALRAWNAAVGTRGGEDTAYKLEPSGTGLFALIDAPKTVKAEIVGKLPGHYLNKSDSEPEQREPNAGFFDETGWVYVSAPELLPAEPEEAITLRASVVGAPTDAEPAFYCLQDGRRVPIPCGERIALAPGTRLYVVPARPAQQSDAVLSDVTLNGVSILESFDADEQAYTALMPERSSVLRVSYRSAEVRLLPEAQNRLQLFVGDTLNVYDYAELLLGGSVSDGLCWLLPAQTPEAVLRFADESRQTVVAQAEGAAELWAVCAGNESVGVPLLVEVFDSPEQTVRVSYNEQNAAQFALSAQYGETSFRIPRSGWLVKKGTLLTVVPTQTEPVVLSSVRMNGIPVLPGQTMLANGDISLSVDFRSATVENMPEELRFAQQGESCQLRASVRYAEPLASLLPVYDRSIRYQSSDPLVTVDETGLLTVAGPIPAEGACVLVTAFAGSGNDRVFRTTRVILGSYAGSEIVGRLTIMARSISLREPIAHTSIVFTTYEDLDLDVSYYRYYKPTEAYISLMDDYRRHPERYPSDPATYSEELALGDREGYFEELVGGVGAPPETIRLKSGEGFTVSDYSHDSYADVVLKALEDGQLSSSRDVQLLVEQIRRYTQGETLDANAAFDSLAATLLQIAQTTLATGQNPADGRAEGGRDLNREVFNRFRSPSTRLPNNFYTVELTADELTALKAYLADPENNYYALMTKNCAGDCVELWNYVLADRPELRLTGNYTGIVAEPMSVYLELEQLRRKTGRSFNGTGEGGGTDFSPHIAFVGRSGAPEPPTLPFTDVPETSYCYDAVLWAYYAVPQIAAGMTETEFRPDESCTRGQVVTFLWRAAGKPEPSAEGGNPFTDVKEGRFYYSAVLWAAEAGITKGVTPTQFAPNESCTRGQVVTFLWRAAGEPKPSAAAENPFVDVEAGAFYEKAVLWAVEQGVTKGVTQTEFRPNATCTRGQVVTFLYRCA